MPTVTPPLLRRSHQTSLSDGIHGDPEYERVLGGGGGGGVYAKKKNPQGVGGNYLEGFFGLKEEGLGWVK